MVLLRQTYLIYVLDDEQPYSNEEKNPGKEHGVR